jgi:hypothetical protein
MVKAHLPPCALRVCGLGRPQLACALSNPDVLNRILIVVNLTRFAPQDNAPPQDAGGRFEKNWLQQAARSPSRSSDSRASLRLRPHGSGIRLLSAGGAGSMINFDPEHSAALHCRPSRDPCYPGPCSQQRPGRDAARARLGCLQGGLSPLAGDIQVL